VLPQRRHADPFGREDCHASRDALLGSSGGRPRDRLPLAGRRPGSRRVRGALTRSDLLSQTDGVCGLFGKIQRRAGPSAVSRDDGDAPVSSPSTPSKSLPWETRLDQPPPEASGSGGTGERLALSLIQLLWASYASTAPDSQQRRPTDRAQMGFARVAQPAASTDVWGQKPSWHLRPEKKRPGGTRFLSVELVRGPAPGAPMEIQLARLPVALT